MRRVVRSSIAAAALLSACSNTTPGVPSVSFAAPAASGPSNGTSFKYNAQPITLGLQTAVRTAPARDLRG